MNIYTKDRDGERIRKRASRMGRGEGGREGEFERALEEGRGQGDRGRAGEMVHHLTH